jgi:geranylgeranyl pyrophosphate synthase
MYSRSSTEKSASDFVSHFESRFQKVLAPHPKNLLEPGVLREAAWHLSVNTNAKRARPLLVDAFGVIAEAPLRFRIDAAIAAELMHGASLMHDDVVDEGKIRRGKPTVNEQWNNSVAVLSGDWMLTQALKSLSGYGEATLQNAIQVVAQMTQSAILEVEARANTNLTLDLWRSIAEGKTGALFSFCGSAPAQMIGKQELSVQLAQCGFHLGIAFQIVDDLKDLLDGSTGKNAYADLYNRNISYPIATAISQSPEFKSFLTNSWELEDIPKETIHDLQLWMFELDVFTETAAACEEELRLAQETLGTLSYRPGGMEIKKWVNQLQDFVRQFRTNQTPTSLK